MKTYLVGGAVRDTLLGLEPKDKDYVIVGATPEDVDNLVSFQGYQQVGADFPVFLHPVTGDEYALARIERKVGTGYNGFEAFTSPDLTIEDDLRRRDLTINAMAMDLESGEIIDPFGGQEDLKNGVLRHISEAFAEDPLRVLRVARFKARYGFEIHHTTMKLMHELIESGELDHLTRERIWVEIEKLLMEKKNSIGGIMALHVTGALDRLFGWNIGEHIVTISKCSSDVTEAFESLGVISKFAVFSFFGQWSEDTMQIMKFPKEFQKAHTMYRNLVVPFMYVMEKNADEMMTFLEDAGLLRNSNTFDNIVDALGFSVGKTFGERAKARRVSRITRCLEAAQTVDCAALSSGMKNGKEIAMKIRAARVEAIDNFLKVSHA